MRSRLTGLIQWCLSALVLVALTARTPGAGTPAALAQPASGRPEPRSFELVGQAGGAIDTVAVRDGYAYVGRGGELVILDISSPGQPQVVGSGGGHGGKVKRIRLAGEYAYVTVESEWKPENGGIRVMRISDPANPVEVGFYLTGPQYPLLAMAGSYGYVWDNGGDQSNRLVDFSDPAEPKDVVTGVLSRVIFAIVDGRAYAWGDHQIEIFDVSDPAHPMLVGTVKPDAPPSTATAEGAYLYVISEARVLEIVDVSDPAAPRVVGQADYSRDMPDSITVSGGRAYLTSKKNQLLTVVDVSDPSRPTTGGSARIEEDDAWGVMIDVAAAGDYAYVAAGVGGLRVFAVGEAGRPAEIAAYEGPARLDGTVSVAREGGYAYVADRSNGLHIVRVENPAHPVSVGRYSDDGEAWRVAVRGRYAFLLEQGGLALQDELVILDVEDPTFPKRIASVDLPNLRGNDLVLAGSYAYVATSASLRVIDVSDPTDPREVGQFTVPEPRASDPKLMIADRQARIAVDGQLVYMAYVTEMRFYGAATSFASSEGTGLSVIDVSNPTSPVELHRLNVNVDPRAVAAAGPYVYVLDYGIGSNSKSGLRIFDVSNPASPIQGGSLTMDTFGASNNIVFVGHYAYVVGHGLHVLDVADPVRPVEVGAYDRGSINSVATDGSLAYVGAEREGLKILRFAGDDAGPSTP
jgi:hypothetical protein